jgi:hypothetical protein
VEAWELALAFAGSFVAGAVLMLVGAAFAAQAIF